MMDNLFQEFSENLQKEDLSGLLNDIPPELDEVLLLEEESIKKFEKHIQTQKAKVDHSMNQLIMHFTCLCHEAKNKAFDSLDSQLRTFRANHDYLRRKLILFYPKNLSVSQIANKDAIVKEIQKANNYLEIEALLKQIQNDLDEIKVFKTNSQSTSYTCLQELAKMVQKQVDNLPFFQSNLLGNIEALNNAFTKATTSFFEEHLSITNRIKEISIHTVSRLDTVLNINSQAVDFLYNVVAMTHPSPKFKLLYRGSRDGFRAHNFHSRCDKKGPTVVIIQSDHGKIFGGFAGASWTSTSTYVSSQDSFLFSLTDPTYYPIKKSQEQWALCCGPNSGPIFGRNPDLSIVDKCATEESSFSIGLTYQSNNHSDTKIAGGSTFRVKEIEVFAVEAGESIMEPVMEPAAFQSDLLNDDQCLLLKTWIDPYNIESMKLQLIYKATKDGFDSNDFHRLCDGKKNTVVLIKSAEPNSRVFGGYTTKEWDRTNKFTSDRHAFVFSISERKKCAIKDEDRAIFKYSEAGPVFGEGYDIFICSNSNILKHSTTRLGHTYESNIIHGNSLSGSPKAFLVAEIEVFVVQYEEEMMLPEFNW